MELPFGAWSTHSKPEKDSLSSVVADHKPKRRKGHDDSGTPWIAHWEMGTKFFACTENKSPAAPARQAATARRKTASIPAVGTSTGLAVPPVHIQGSAQRPRQLSEINIAALNGCHTDSQREDDNRTDRATNRKCREVLQLQMTELAPVECLWQRSMRRCLLPAAQTRCLTGRPFLRQAFIRGHGSRPNSLDGAEARRTSQDGRAIEKMIQPRPAKTPGIKKQTRYWTVRRCSNLIPANWLQLSQTAIRLCS